MFFIIGINDGRKDLDFNQTVICSRCGRYGSYRVYRTFLQLLLFFIPCFKWGKKYYVEMSCCGTTYHLAPEVGKRIAKGEMVTIQDSDLSPLSFGTYTMIKHCSTCGYQTTEGFDFCPKCGTRFPEELN